jgi:hypothetical protein
MRFPARIIKNGREISLISFVDSENPYISFSPVNIAELSDADKFYVTFGEETTVRIGRLDENGLYLTDQTVSRHHAVLQI